MIVKANRVLVQDEGVLQGYANTLDFVGAGVTASFAGTKATVTIPGGAGVGATGQATLNFGAFPGNVEAFTDVAGQVGLTVASEIDAWILPVATADHSADEHLIERIRIVARWLVDGTLRIHGYDDASPAWRVPNNRPEQAQRLFGLFTVAWAWS